ncbi:glutaminase A [Arthrobacter sp. 2RAF6]|uniref:glutaminase A n=1 Tax=Arthrobacter sp. 2RAF6 TaxID=3233002 RepID=UPI003F91C540
MQLLRDPSFQRGVTEQALRAATTGRVTRGIPALSNIDRSKFGVAIATLDGDLVTWGDSHEPFSVQSLSKLFSLCALLRLVPSSWTSVGWSPTLIEYNSLEGVEARSGIPLNPFVNAGALLVTDRLEALTGDAVCATRELLRLSNPAAAWRVDAMVAKSEAAVSHRNKSIGYQLASYQLLYADVDRVLTSYFRQCALTANCIELASAALFLADRESAYRVLPKRLRHQVNSVMLMSGTYSGAPDVSFQIGLPTKSGVGGGLLSVAPGQGAICVWSPPLDRRGNSSGGLAALSIIASALDWSIF